MLLAMIVGGVLGGTFGVGVQLALGTKSRTEIIGTAMCASALGAFFGCMYAMLPN